MGQRTRSGRAAALRRAREAKAERDAARLLRERQIEAVLADFYQATGRSARIRAEGRARAAKIIADADTSAAGSDAAAGRAVRELRALGQTNAEIAFLCCITVPMVRAMANKPRAAGPADPQGGSGAPGPVAEPPATGDRDGERDAGPAETASGGAAVAAPPLDGVAAGMTAAD